MKGRVQHRLDSFDTRLVGDYAAAGAQCIKRLKNDSTFTLRCSFVEQHPNGQTEANELTIVSFSRAETGSIDSLKRSLQEIGPQGRSDAGASLGWASPRQRVLCRRCGHVLVRTSIGVPMAESLGILRPQKRAECLRRRRSSSCYRRAPDPARLTTVLLLRPYVTGQSRDLRTGAEYS